MADYFRRNNEKRKSIRKTRKDKENLLRKSKKIKGEIKAAEKNQERKTKRELLKIITDVLALEEDSLNIFFKDNHSLLVGFLVTELDEDTKLKYIKAGEKILLKIENEKLKKKEKIKMKEEDINE
ncbi:hypothetical protein [Fusobacterium hwasookii]|uniref:hypothetical protein n=2 Tax=Fusobacterium hwasookii TaxID=1583098 RepID=UPI0004973B68|nr:hypothetical protein [Fusobacterium hwasookii]